MVSIKLVVKAHGKGYDEEEDASDEVEEIIQSVEQEV